MKGRIFVSVILILVLQHAVCLADPIKEVISTSPSWESFTNEDGTGLYHEILAAVFNPKGIRVTHKYTNATRGMVMVEKNLADFYTCRNEINDFPDLMLARYPMYEGTFYAIFKISRIRNWQGASSLSKKTVVWRRGYYRESEFDVKLNVLEADSGPSALAQVIFGRADFYIDDLNLIKESISGLEFPFDKRSYRTEPVGKRTYKPVFKASERGKAILAIYDSGMEALHRSGKLREIFEKWHHPYPDYSALK